VVISCRHVTSNMARQDQARVQPLPRPQSVRARGRGDTGQRVVETVGISIACLSCVLEEWRVFSVRASSAAATWAGPMRGDVYADQPWPPAGAGSALRWSQNRQHGRGQRTKPAVSRGDDHANGTAGLLTARTVVP
jgi:hypothetical protein